MSYSSSILAAFLSASINLPGQSSVPSPKPAQQSESTKKDQAMMRAGVILKRMRATPAMVERGTQSVDPAAVRRMVEKNGNALYMARIFLLGDSATTALRECRWVFVPQETYDRFNQSESYMPSTSDKVYPAEAFRYLVDKLPDPSRPVTVVVK